MVSGAEGRGGSGAWYIYIYIYIYLFFLTNATNQVASHPCEHRQQCDSTNSKLRHVYQHFITTGEALTSPSGVSYEASTALTYVNKLCGKDEAADKAEAKLLATHKKTHLRTALVKTNHQHAHAPQSESGAMATEHANHGAPVGNHMGTMASATPMGGQHVMPMGER